MREEFPDVTISKIRFLESRGLLDPERTPSGYRKFYEPDVDRLRWILRQQREHFLPLKVIKGRLENGMSDPEAPTPHLFEMGDPPPERQAQPVLVGAPETGDISRERQAAIATVTALAAVSSSAGRTPGHSGAQALARNETDRPGERVSEQDLVSAGAAAAADVRRTQAEEPTPEHAETESPPAAASRRHRRPSAAETKAGPADEQAKPNQESRPEEPAPPKRPPSRPTAGLPGAALSGVSLTIAELAAASGLDVAGVEELESFGLIAGRTVAGVHCYDEDAVLVAKLAARFAPYGIEARHLRVFKHASDRQTGLFAQVVTPLLRQRNPEAHARAAAELAELAELGEALMRCFSQATLRELTGG